MLTRLAPGQRAEGPPPTAGGWSLHTAGSSAGVMVSWGGPTQRADDIDARIAALADRSGVSPEGAA
jgi:hypothetical protein